MTEPERINITRRLLPNLRDLEYPLTAMAEILAEMERLTKPERESLV